MNRFTTPAIVEVLDKHLFRIVEPFEYHVGHYLSQDIIQVPSGFVTDFASVPRIFWNIIPPYGKYTKASIIHDYLYETGLRSRKTSDRIFLEGMLALRVPKIKAMVMYRAVRWFGWYAYNKHKRKRKVHKVGQSYVSYDNKPE